MHYSEHLAPGQISASATLMALAYLPFTLWLDPRVSLFVAALIALRIAACRWPALVPGRWLLLPLTLAGGINVLSAYGTVSGRAAGSALLATMLALKLLEIRGKRDVRLLTVLFGFLLASQFLFDQSPLLVAYLMALLVANLALMADLTARIEPRPLAGALRLAGRLTLVSVPLAIALFLLFPRLSAPLWSLGDDETVGITGLSDRLEPGTITELILSGEPAFRVWFEGQVPTPDQMYWRGPVLWQMDGRRWGPGSEGLLETPAQPLARADGLVDYRVSLEPNDQRWLLALDMPVAIPDGSQLTSDYQVKASSSLTTSERYRLTSATRYETGTLNPAMAEAGRQLPPNVTPRMRALVADWRRGGASAREVVARGLAHLNREAFYYTLLPPPLGANPTDELLFETRQGFCEHYASAFAVLLRLANIPTRVVLGYHGGERNPMGDYYIVRQSDAHAWVEAWLPGEGWRRIDPTAAIAPERIERGPILDRLGATTPLRLSGEELSHLAWLGHRLQLAADALRTGWQNWVLDFSTSQQLALLSLLGLGYLSTYGLTVAMTLVAATVLGLTVLFLARRRRQDPLEALFDRFVTRLARIGLHRHPSEGPRDFGHRVVARRPDLRADVEAFVSLYTRLRYGRANPILGLPLLRRRLQRIRPRRSTIKRRG
jgi:transglutaminase-like putative cysteine protease